MLFLCFFNECTQSCSRSSDYNAYSDCNAPRSFHRVHIAAVLCLQSVCTAYRCNAGVRRLKIHHMNLPTTNAFSMYNFVCIRVIKSTIKYGLTKISRLLPTAHLNRSLSQSEHPRWQRVEGGLPAPQLLTTLHSERDRLSFLARID